MLSPNHHALCCFIFSLSLIFTFASSKADDNPRAKRSDDFSLTSLKAVIDQQMSLTQSLQAALQAEKNRATAAEASLLSKLTSAESKITALESDNSALQTRVATLSKSVAFTVRFKQDDGIKGIPIGSNSPLRFDQVLLNTGGGYDPQTGIFTAPLAGTYAFFLSQMGVSDHGTLDLAIVKHGVIIDLVYSKDHEDQGSSQVTSHLEKSQQVWVRHYYGNAVRGAWFTVFTGYLLHAD